MEALSSINSNAVIKQSNTIVRETNKEVCKNRIEMPFDDLLKDTIKKLMPYAMFLTYKNEADSEDLVQYTILKLIKNKDKFLEHPNPMAYAKLILKNKSSLNLFLFINFVKSTFVEEIILISKEFN